MHFEHYALNLIFFQHLTKCPGSNQQQQSTATSNNSQQQPSTTNDHPSPPVRANKSQVLMLKINSH